MTFAQPTLIYIKAVLPGAFKLTYARGLTHSLGNCPWPRSWAWSSRCPPT